MTSVARPMMLSVSVEQEAVEAKIGTAAGCWESLSVTRRTSRVLVSPAAVLMEAMEDRDEEINWSTRTGKAKERLV